MKAQVRDPEFMRIVHGVRLGVRDSTLGQSPVAVPHTRGTGTIVAWIVTAAVAVIALIGGFVLAGPAAGASSTGDCDPIHYVVNPSGAPSEALTDIQAALALTSDASGLRFVFDGLTSEQPSPYREGAPVLIAWADPSLFASLTDSSEVAGWTHTVRVTEPTGEQLVSGWVYLNSAQDRPSGMTDRQSWGGVLVHEFGHLAGLLHSTQTSQMMYPTMTSGPIEWGHEDLARLRRIGEHLGCRFPPR